MTDFMLFTPDKQAAGLPAFGPGSVAVRATAGPGTCDKAPATCLKDVDYIR
jgi:hypothetical protein